MDIGEQLLAVSGGGRDSRCGGRGGLKEVFAIKSKDPGGRRGEESDPNPPTRVSGALQSVPLSKAAGDGWAARSLPGAIHSPGCHWQVT